MVQWEIRKSLFLSPFGSRFCSHQTILGLISYVHKCSLYHVITFIYFTHLAIIIAELNEKKNIAVEKAYKQVNKDFSSIFSTLLPGATAKLAPPEGATCLEGLEVRVGFGDVWKDSLTELSGGQRYVCITVTSPVHTSYHHICHNCFWQIPAIVVYNL